MISRKNIIILLFVVVALLCLTVFFFSGPKKGSDITNFPPNGDTIVAFGDSLVVGVGDIKDGGFTGDLSRIFNTEIINKGTSGDTTADGLKRIEDILAEDPDIVLLLFGGNDALKKIPLKETKKNLEKMIQKLQNEGAVIILLGIQGGLLKDPYEKMYESLAEEYGTLYVPNVLEGVIGNSQLMSDRIHPNTKGYGIIARKIEPKLGRVLESITK